jgi:ribosomal protein S19
VLNRIKELKQKFILGKSSDSNDSIVKEAQENSIKLFNFILNYNLCCKRMIQIDRLSTKAFDFIIGEIENRFNQSIVKPGEMVGSIAEVYSGKYWTPVEIKAEMVGQYLGEYSMTYKPIKHGKVGHGATRGSKFVSLR